ncbi:MAG: lysophospholipid acyltransferase family protein [Candidatus Hydrogenedentes bacterium]|nr:lysophospholipid acyltransferase family protein [Candidatus Hydrogenedentota bacterium]
MRYTIFDTPVVSPVLRAFAIVILKLIGWRVDGAAPEVSKYVATFAPHTSNWDLMLVVLIGLVLRVPLRWMGKISLFRAPFGWVIRWLGGVPVDRAKANNTVIQAIRHFKENDRFVLGIAPEGTRKHVDEWKLGFYYIANGAGVPIATTYLDYGKKQGGFGPTFQPTGVAEGDVAEIRTFYAGISGKRSRGAT